MRSSCVITAGSMLGWVTVLCVDGYVCVFVWSIYCVTVWSHNWRNPPISNTLWYLQSIMDFFIFFSVRQGRRFHSLLHWRLFPGAQGPSSLWPGSEVLRYKLAIAFSIYYDDGADVANSMWWNEKANSTYTISDANTIQFCWLCHQPAQFSFEKVLKFCSH